MWASSSITPGQGDGLSISYDCQWPQAVKDAERRFWSADKAKHAAERAMTEPICTIARELMAEPVDVAKMLFMSAERVREIIIRDNRARLERYAREQTRGGSDVDATQLDAGVVLGSFVGQLRDRAGLCVNQNV